MMNIKKLVVALTLSFTMLILTGCLHFLAWAWAEQSRPKKSTTPEFQDARGGAVSVCGYNSIMSQNSGEAYLKYHGLPVEIQGNFICENGKPALPKDCQGKEFRSENELRVYWEKHQLPVGLIRFECKNGVPSVQPHAIPFWQKVERTLGGSCKDTQGKPRYCI